MTYWRLTSIARFLKLSRPLLLELMPSFPAAEMMDILDTGLSDATLEPPGEWGLLHHFYLIGIIESG